MKYSLVIPCYNEAANIPALIERCAALGQRGDFEVVLVNNGSTDGSFALMKSLAQKHSGFLVVDVAVNKGYGFGILSGLKAATGDVLGWTHADLQTDPLDSLNAISFFTQNNTNIFVKGKRFGRPIADVMFTVGMSCFETFLLRQPLWDINAQPTFFPRSFFDQWDDAPFDFSLDLYAYFRARKLGLTIHRFPVRFGQRLHGVSHWNVDWASKRKFISRTIDYSMKLKKDLKS
jgi:glycosyltransferase involved in cell wall biosynthesis